MWFQLIFSLVLVQILSFNLAKDSRSPNEPTNRETETIFAGVIKNISRVNTVLQELINNYEQLQKIYKSQENFDVQSSDGEIDEVYKSKKKKNVEDGDSGNVGNSRSNMMTTTVRSTPGKDGYPATQMIWSDDDKPKDNSEIISSNEESDIAKQANKEEPKTEIEINLQQPTPRQIEIATVEDKVIKVKKKRKPKITEETTKTEAEVIFIDMHSSTTKKKKAKPSLEPMIEVSFNKPSSPIIKTTSDSPAPDYKTRYSKISPEDKLEPIHKKRKKKKPLHPRTEQELEPIRPREPNNDFVPINVSLSNPTTKIVATKMHSELLPPKNIWDEIINNKPIELQTQSEMTLAKMRKAGKEEFSLKQKISQRSRDKVQDNEKRTALIFLAKNNKSDTVKAPISESHSEESEKEELQATVLREAYGDACLKLVVRKCYKACKEAGKVVCSRYKCKGSYKDSYANNSKTGCLKKFNVKTKNKNGDKAKNDDSNDDEGGSVFERASQKSESSESPEKFARVNANEYLRACLPHIQAETRRAGVADIDFINSTYHIPAQPPPTFNILRDKYERACKKISFDKCREACKFAYTKTCESFTCNNSRKRAYRKACATKCRSSYKSGRGRASSSDSSGSGSSGDSSGST